MNVIPYHFYAYFFDSFNPNQSGLFGLSIERGGGGMCLQEFLSYFVLVFHHKSTKQGLKWKLTSLYTCRVFEHHPKLHSFAVRRHRSWLLWPRKFFNFRCYNFWKFIIFVLHGQYVYQMKAGNILNTIVVFGMQIVVVGLSWLVTDANSLTHGSDHLKMIPHVTPQTHLWASSFSDRSLPLKILTFASRAQTYDGKRFFVSFLGR